MKKRWKMEVLALNSRPQVESTMAPSNGSRASFKELPKECFNKKVLVAGHEKARLAAELALQHNGKQKSEKTSSGGSAESGKSSPSISLSSQPLSSLKEIFLPQLEADKRHHGRVLFGTLFVRPFRASSSVILSILADKSGKAVSLSILNMPFSLTEQDIEARLAAGQKVAIKEPYLIVCELGKAMIPVENPADLVLVDDANKAIYRSDSVYVDEILEGVLNQLDDLRAEGNRLFGEQKWKEAIAQYRKCIARGIAVLEEGEENEKISQRLLLAYSNRAEVWLQRGDYKNALDDANKALEFDPNHQKSVNRRDRAWQGFGKAQNPSSNVKAAVEDTNFADKDLDSKIKPKDVSQPVPMSSKGKSTIKANFPPSNVSAGNGKGSKPISPPPTTESAIVDSKNNPGISSETVIPLDTESETHAVDVLISAITTSRVKGSAEAKQVSLPSPMYTEHKNQVGVVKTSGSSISKVKVTALKSVSPPLSMDTETENHIVAVDKSATTPFTVKGTKLKRVSPPPRKASKLKHLETKNIQSATSVTPTKRTKLSSTNADQRSASVDQLRANADPASSAKRKVATSSNLDEIAAADVDSGRHSSDSNSESDKESHSPESSSVEKLTDDADDDNQDYPVIERKPLNGATDDSTLPPKFPDSKLALRTSTEPHKLMAAAVGTSDAAINTELPGFAAWLDSIRLSADVLLSQGNWSEAVKLYNDVTGLAIPQRNRDKVIQILFLAYSHRSEAWIWTGDFEKSLHDANSAIKILDNYPKSVVGYEGKHLLNEVRRGRALHGLGEYEKACLVFHDALLKYPNEKSINKLLSKSSIALRQSQKGIYDLDEWFAARCPEPPPSCSDFVGPVEIRRVLAKGRGLFATKDVEAGDLLVVSTPLLVVRRKFNSGDGEDYRNLAAQWRRSRPDLNPFGFDDFVKRLSRLRAEKQIHQLYCLTGGDPHDEIEVPHMSLFSPGAQHVRSPWGFDNLTISDGPQKLQRIARIVVRNAMEGGLNPLDEKDDSVKVGLWALPSFLNHSCVPNCHMIDIGDAMFVRASRNIRQGEELTRAYFDVYKNGIDRCKLCAEWNFCCNCERCILEKSLVDQGILPAHEYRALLERAREESLKRQQYIGREKSLSVLLPTPQPALLQLQRFADWCDGLLDQAEGLGSKEKAWIGASHIEAYISRFQGSKDRTQFMLGLENILEFMTNTAILAIGHTTGSALEKAALLLAQVEDMYGRGSQTYRRIETRVLGLYHATFGALSKEVLFTVSRLITR